MKKLIDYPDELDARIQAEADKEDRSQNNMIRRLLVEALDARRDALKS